MNFLEGYVTKGLNWIGEKVTGEVAEILVDVLTSPVIVVLSIGVYALLQMFSRRLAKMGVIGVFIYGALVVLI